MAYPLCPMSPGDNERTGVLSEQEIFERMEGKLKSKQLNIFRLYIDYILKLMLISISVLRIIKDNVCLPFQDKKNPFMFDFKEKFSSCGGNLNIRARE